MSTSGVTEENSTNNSHKQPNDVEARELTENVAARCCVDALIGDQDLQEDAIRHLVNICNLAARSEWKEEFTVEGTGATHKLGKVLAHNLDKPSKCRRYEGGGNGSGAVRDAALIHVLEWLKPWRGKPREEIQFAAAAGAFRYIAVRFSDRWSNAMRDAANRRRLAFFLHPDSSTIHRGDDGDVDDETLWAWVTPGIEDEFARDLFVMDLKRALRQLYSEKPTQACSEDIRALLLTAIAGWSYEECAAELDIPVPALKTRVHRLRKRMTPTLKAYIR